MKRLGKRPKRTLRIEERIVVRFVEPSNLHKALKGEWSIDIEAKGIPMGELLPYGDRRLIISVPFNTIIPLTIANNICTGRTPCRRGWSWHWNKAKKINVLLDINPIRV